MCRLLGYCAREAVSLAQLIGDEGLSGFTALSAVHNDGWGMAWYEGTEPQVHTSLDCAAGAPAYTKLAEQPLGDLGLVHFRWATPGLAITEANSHPFRYGPYLMAHNGAIHPQHRLPEMLPPEWEQRLGGTTDSERYFLGIMSRLPSHDGDVVAAIAAMASDIERKFAPGSLNALLLSPDKLYAINWHNQAKVPDADLLRRRGHEPRPGELESYFDLAYRVTGDAVVVASSGWPQPGWAVLPNHHVLVCDRGTLQTSVLPLTAAGTLAGEGTNAGPLAARPARRPAEMPVLPGHPGIRVAPAQLARRRPVVRRRPGHTRRSGSRPAQSPARHPGHRKPAAAG
ncbi:MAG: class II glutamine amidotransferase [Actinomycetota bacterium]